MQTESSLMALRRLLGIHFGCCSGIQGQHLDEFLPVFFCQAPMYREKRSPAPTSRFEVRVLRHQGSPSRGRAACRRSPSAREHLHPCRFARSKRTICTILREKDRKSQIALPIELHHRAKYASTLLRILIAAEIRCFLWGYREKRSNQLRRMWLFSRQRSQRFRVVPNNQHARESRCLMNMLPSRTHGGMRIPALVSGLSLWAEIRLYERNCSERPHSTCLWLIPKSCKGPTRPLWRNRLEKNCYYRPGTLLPIRRLPYLQEVFHRH